MVASIDTIFESSKKFFDNGDINSSIDRFEEVILNIDKDKDGSVYTQFLEKILDHCKKNQLKKEEALVLRALGRIYSIFKQYDKSKQYHNEALKIQKKLGRKMDLAEGLELLAEDMEIAGNHEECINALKSAANMYKVLGSLRKVKDIQKEITRLETFSKQMDQDDYYLKKFHIDEY